MADCQTCGSPFETVASQRLAGNGRYCSRERFHRRNVRMDNGLTVCRTCETPKPPEEFGTTPKGAQRTECKNCRSHRERRRRKARAPGVNLSKRLQGLYGLTLEQYTALLEKQGGVCSICGRSPEEAGVHRLVVDHDHATGRVRGLLYQSCNRGLGNFADSMERLASAARYLAHPPAS